MEDLQGNLGIDEERLRAADPDGLYLFMLRDYPYMMTPKHVAEFTGTSGQEVRRVLGRGELRGCRMGTRWLIPKVALLEYLYAGQRRTGEGKGDGEAGGAEPEAESAPAQAAL